jgi:tetratricopeptide (TPR) repeat protein
MDKNLKRLAFGLAVILLLCIYSGFIVPQQLFCQDAAPINVDNNAGAHYYRAKELDRQGSFSEAIAELQKALAINPSFAKAHLMLGVVYFRTKRYDEAIEEMKVSISLGLDSHNTAVAYYDMGSAYIVKGMKEEALQQYRNSLKADPSYKDARTALNRMGKKTSARGVHRRSKNNGFTILPFVIVFYALTLFISLRNYSKKKNGVRPKQELPEGSTYNSQSAGFEDTKKRGGCEGV